MAQTELDGRGFGRACVGRCKPRPTRFSMARRCTITAGRITSQMPAAAFYVPQFNPALGTLTSVELIVEGDSYGGTNGFQNTTAFSGTASVNIGSLFMLPVLVRLLS